MAETITIRSDEETEHALAMLTGEGLSRSAAIRKAVIEAAERCERAARLRRAVLELHIGEPGGVDVAGELARDRGDET
jgi:ribosomal protein S12 methylthiotransferase accessory factor YcaO